MVKKQPTRKDKPNTGIPEISYRQAILLCIVALVAMAVYAFIIKPITVPSSGQEKSAVNYSSECSEIRTKTTMISTAFSDGTDTPEQIGLLLSDASSSWSASSLKTSGSMSQWLAKMSELSDNLRSFVLTGYPENGTELLGQLTNNMQLVSQFCG